ncbi:MAG: putative lipid II flippase FtsW [Actinobacteria bacterium]|nr:putative lipid II flippase FtsW [Actinomycetota bacterium]
MARKRFQEISRSSGRRDPLGVGDEMLTAGMSAVTLRWVEVPGRERLSRAFHWTWILALVLTCAGLVMIYSVSTAQGFFAQNELALDRIRDQGVAALLGLAALLVLSRLDYRRLRPMIMLFTLVVFGLLFAVWIPQIGREANEAARWLDIGPLPIQPSEIAKLMMVVLAAHLLSTTRAKQGRFGVLFWPLAPVAGLATGLVLLQPDLGTAFMLAIIVMGLWWQSGMPLKEWIVIAALGILLVAVAILTSDYRRERFLVFVNPFNDPQGDGWQIVQSFLALASGGWWGVGPGRSVQKFNYLPDAHTDMIFSIVGEEFGFVGVGVLLLAFVLLVVCVFRVAAECTDPFGRYLAGGVGLMIAGQAVVNLGGVMGVLPLTGIPLPFVSFGRTNLVMMLAGVGMVLAVARYGPVRIPVPMEADSNQGELLTLERGFSNVTYLDRRRRHSRSCSAGLGDR